MSRTPEVAAKALFFLRGSTGIQKLYVTDPTGRCAECKGARKFIVRPEWYFTCFEDLLSEGDRSQRKMVVNRVSDDGRVAFCMDSCEKIRSGRVNFIRS